MKHYSKEFKELESKWYKKLKDEGFDDLENSYGRLKTGANNNIENIQTVDSFNVRQEYYRLAGHFLHEYTFHTWFDKTVWKFHTEGKSIRNIVSILSNSGHKTHRDQVDIAVQKLRKLMIKKYGVKDGIDQQE